MRNYLVSSLQSGQPGSHSSVMTWEMQTQAPFLAQTLPVQEKHTDNDTVDDYEAAVL